MTEAGPLLPVYPRLDVELAGAEGCELITADGRRLLDMYGGHAVSALGHAHPAIARALARAHETLDFYSNSLHMPAQAKAARDVLGESAHLRRVHFVNSGTEANEAALHLARRMTGRTTAVTFDCSFHGRTLASLAATGMESYRRRLSVEPDERWHRRIRFGDPRDLELIDEDAACVLAESVPSLAGVMMPPAGYYPALAARCQEVGALLVFDEVQGGVGRLGRWFAHELFGVRPDMVTLAKSLGSGFPVGALVCTEEVARGVDHGELGTTFGGGPMACAVVSAVASTIRADGLMERAERIFEGIAGRLAGIDGVTVRGAGCLIGVDTPGPARRLRDRLVERGVLVGLSARSHTLRLLPPYVLSDEQIQIFCDAFEGAVHA